MITGWLPYPPSVNKYWMRVMNRVCRSPLAQQYSKDAVLCVKSQKLKKIKAEKYQLSLTIRPPDLRRRDIDNICKAALDVLQHAGLFDDDYDVWRLEVERSEPTKNGQILFTLKEYINNA